MTCPICDHELTWIPTNPRYKNYDDTTHIYKCPECPFIGFEFYTDKNHKELGIHLDVKQTNYIRHSSISELAHRLTERECKIKKIDFEYSPRGEVQYTNEAQEIFYFYYELIEKILNI